MLGVGPCVVRVVASFYRLFVCPCRCLFLLMSNRFKKICVVSWNVRGLGDPDKCAIVKDALVSAAPALICLQETKLRHIDQF